MDRKSDKMIIPYKRYTEIRDADWQLILDLQIKNLPVKISAVLAALDIEAYTYKDNRGVLIEFGLEEKMKNCDAFTLSLNNQGT